MKSVVRLLGIFLVLVSFASVASAQFGVVKHPRVAELENTLTKDASAFLKGRFPELPFLVKVSVDPLHRYDSMSAPSQGKTEKLPYYEAQEDEEIRDEWDDPAFPDHGLMSRVKKAVVTISLPNSISDDETAEVQQTLAQVLNFTPARDEVVIQKRNWKIGTDYTNHFAGAGGALLLFLIGLFAITRGSVGRLIRAVQETQAAQAKQAPSAPSVPAIAPTDRSNARAKAGLNDVKFSDPIKTREVISHGVRSLAEHPGFPNLRDMIILDRFGEENPASLGALVMEFPVEVQKLLFSYSSGNHWLHAFAEPGDLGSDCLSMLQTLIRQVRDEDIAWQRLLLNVWRLGDERVSYIRSLPQEEALAVLSHLPKTIAVGTARLAFPGSWGIVLDSNFKPKALSKDKVEALSQRAVQMKPLRDFNMLEKFRQERDLLDYLKTSEPAEEREVYGASADDSMIHKMRPPFFKVLELSDEQLDAVVPRISLDDWSFALFNIGKNERRAIEKRFSDKQRYMLFERFKSFDANPPDKTLIGEAREKIAHYVQQAFAKPENVIEMQPEGKREESNAA